MTDYIRYREQPTNDDVLSLFYLGVDRYNHFGDEAEVMKHPGHGLPRYFRPYREGIRCARQGVGYRRPLKELMR